MSAGTKRSVTAGTKRVVTARTKRSVTAGTERVVTARIKRVLNDSDVSTHEENTVTTKKDETDSGQPKAAQPAPEKQPVLPIVEYPKVLYRHDSVDRTTVASKEAEEKLGPGWFPAPKP